MDNPHCPTFKCKRDYPHYHTRSGRFTMDKELDEKPRAPKRFKKPDLTPPAEFKLSPYTRVHIARSIEVPRIDVAKYKFVNMALTDSEVE